MTIEAMKQALEALEEAHPKPYNESVTSHVEAITALRTAIEQAEKQEPVAWVNLDQYGNLHESSSQTVPPDTFPVYRHPPAAQRQPLTEREVKLIDGMIEVQLHHAEQCDRIANRVMAEKQKGWDMERVELLRKLKAAHGIGGGE